MTWPDDRLTTYAPGTQIKSADLNAVQDAVIGRKHGEIDLYFTALDGDWQVGATAPTQFGYEVSAGDANNEWIIPMRLPVGTVIEELEMHYDRSPGGGVVAGDLLHHPWGATGAGTVVGNFSDGASSGEATTQISGLPHTVLTSKIYYARFKFLAVGNKYFGTRIKISKP